MNMNNLLNNATFKKIIGLVLLILTTSWVTHELMFWSFFQNFQKQVDSFNDQIARDQQIIHNKIIESEKNSDKWNRDFDKKQNEFHEAVNTAMKENMDFLQNSHKQMLKQQEAFDKRFAEMPAKMWEAHKDFAGKAFIASKENGKRLDDLQSKQFKDEADKEKNQ